MTLSMNPLKEVHDRLMAEKPDGAVHDSESCPFCAQEETPSVGGDMTTYTEEEAQSKVDAAVAAAVADRDAKITELQAAHQTNEVRDAVAAAVAEKDAEIERISAELDKATIAAGNASTELTAMKAWLEAEAAAAVEREAAAARKDGRVEKLKAIKAFSDEYVEQNADRFAAMADEEFESRLSEYAALVGSRAPGGEIPSGTPGLLAGQEGPSGSGGSAYKELMALRRDPRGVVDLTSL